MSPIAVFLTLAATHREVWAEALSCEIYFRCYPSRFGNIRLNGVTMANE